MIEPPHSQAAQGIQEKKTVPYIRKKQKGKKNCNSIAEENKEFVHTNSKTNKPLYDRLSGSSSDTNKDDNDSPSDDASHG